MVDIETERMLIGVTNNVQSGCKFIIAHKFKHVSGQSLLSVSHSLLDLEAACIFCLYNPETLNDFFFLD